MNSEIIKSFLVGLGFGVDDSSLAKFNNSILSASKRVTALYASVKLLAAGIFWSISKISEGFEQMGYEYRIIAPAINKTLVLRRELLKAYSAAGVNIVRTIQASIKFNMALAKTQMVFKAIAGGVAAKFFPLLTKQMDIFRGKIYANMPKILASLEKFVNFVFKAFEVTTILGARVWSILQRVYDFFYQLHKQTEGWSTIILGVIVAWNALNLAFLATPLGQLIAGLVTLLALWDDFQVWREGGKSLFDWTSFIPTIDAVTNTLKGLWGILDGIVSAVIGIGFAIGHLVTGNFTAALDAWGEAGRSLIGVFGKLWDTIKGLVSTVGAVGGWALQFLGGDKPQASDEQWAKWGQVGKPNPANALGAQSAAANQSNTNQNVQQQTNINVMGSADANGTAKAVASQQGRVNFDMARNMKGATR